MLAANPIADPTGGGKDVVSLGFSRGNELLSHGHWKRQVRKVTAMKMAKFTASNAKFDAAVAMR